MELQVRTMTEAEIYNSWAIKELTTADANEGLENWFLVGDWGDGMEAVIAYVWNWDNDCVENGDTLYVEIMDLAIRKLDCQADE